VRTTQQLRENVDSLQRLGCKTIQLALDEADRLVKAEEAAEERRKWEEGYGDMIKAKDGRDA
jgi:hypothetical protein